MWGPLDLPLQASDGLLAVDAGGTDVGRLGAACGVDDLAGGRGTAAVMQRIAERPVAEWEERLAAAGIGCARVATDLAALPRDPRLATLFESLGATCRAPAAPWRLDP